MFDSSAKESGKNLHHHHHSVQSPRLLYGAACNYKILHLKVHFDVTKESHVDSLTEKPGKAISQAPLQRPSATPSAMSSQHEVYLIQVTRFNDTPLRSDGGLVLIKNLKPETVLSGLQNLRKLLESRQEKNYTIERSVQLGMVRQMEMDWGQGRIDLRTLSGMLHRFAVYLPTHCYDPHFPPASVPDDFKMPAHSVYVVTTEQCSETLQYKLRALGEAVVGETVTATTDEDLAQIAGEIMQSLENKGESEKKHVHFGETKMIPVDPKPIFEAPKPISELPRPVVRRGATVPGSFYYGMFVDLTKETPETRKVRRDEFYARWPNVDHDNYTPGGGFMD